MELIDKEKVIAEIEKRIQELHPTDTHKMQTGEKVDRDVLMWLNALTWVKDVLNSIETKDVDLQSEVSKWLRNNENVIHMEFARHFFNLGLKAREECIKNIPLLGWQTPCADPNYPCENPQMDCINCPRFGHPQGTITMTSMKEKESEQGLVGKETFTTGSWSEIKEDK